MITVRHAVSYWRKKRFKPTVDATILLVRFLTWDGMTAARLNVNVSGPVVQLLVSIIECCELVHRQKAVKPQSCSVLAGDAVMTLAEYSFGAFAILNTARLIGYFPQIMRVHRDTDGAKAVSIGTWTLFAAANIATVSYALVVANDVAMAIVFALNTIGCLAIVGFTVWKRFELGIWQAPYWRQQ
jgi:hypothetical protein